MGNVVRVMRGARPATSKLGLPRKDRGACFSQRFAGGPVQRKGRGEYSWRARGGTGSRSPRSSRPEALDEELPEPLDCRPPGETAFHERAGVAQDLSDLAPEDLVERRAPFLGRVGW